MEYVGEHLMPGKLGQFFVVLSFAGSLVATISYFKSANAKILTNLLPGKGWHDLPFC